MFDADDCLELPPPAYEASQQELDKKIAHAVEVSLTIANAPKKIEAGPGGEEEVWEEWDESLFEAASRQFTETAGAGSSSMGAQAPPPPSQPQEEQNGNRPSGGRSLPVPPVPQAIEPLRIVKKTPNGYSDEKKRFQYDSLQTNQSSIDPSKLASSSSAQSSYPAPAVSSSADAEPEEDTRLPPPPFSLEGPSYEGPRYEEVATPPHIDTPPPTVLSYQEPDSRVSSPLQSPHSPPPSLSFPPPRSQSRHSISSLSQHSHPSSPLPPVPNTTQIHHQSMPPPPRNPVNRVVPRPITTYSTPVKAKTSRSSTFVRVGDFDPSVAYNRHRTHARPIDEPLPSVVDASAFYKSSVAAHIPTTPARSYITSHPAAPSTPGLRSRQSFGAHSGGGFVTPSRQAPPVPSISPSLFAGSQMSHFPSSAPAPPALSPARQSVQQSSYGQQQQTSYAPQQEPSYAQQLQQSYSAYSQQQPSYTQQQSPYGQPEASQAQANPQYNQANYAASTYAPSQYTPSTYEPSVYAPTTYTPSPSTYAPTSYAPSTYAPTAYDSAPPAQSQWAPSQYGHGDPYYRS
ncbi:hypothetical protein JAAARDRAFT_187849 [Jaapia argillacea MUCL 33604]|uniref:Uncharacterized protein n=1 Tax=Jaapia argillacea MUCL 33604 TaxID=933084 RepID=A0A067QPH3_9AGAM|nr:hypothetical protein JAAARDRAFT_187849 [Jaapia argillacea MUCL 33604]